MELLEFRVSFFMSDKNEKTNAEKKDLNIIKLKKGETVNITKALGSSKRLNILKHLTEDELNLSEIAEKIDSTPQAVYHHLNILEKSKLVRVVREEKIKNMAKTIKYYRANYQPDGINVLLWAPLDQVDTTNMKARIPIPERAVERIARKIGDKLFLDKTDFKIEILTIIVKDAVDLIHASMENLKSDYELEIDEKLWDLLLLFSELSIMNVIKKMVEEEEKREHLDDLLSLLFEEKMEKNGLHPPLDENINELLD